VSSFSKNLVSGIAINNGGYHQTLGNDRLVIIKGVATGKLNEKVGLFQMDPEIDPKALPLVLQNKSSVIFTNEYEAKTESESDSDST
jgi:hypothetical protein